MSARRHRYALALAAALLLGLLSVLVVQSIGNTRLTETLRISRIQQARAYVMSSERARAEHILWEESDRVFPTGNIPPDALWNGTRHQREVLWALVEMQARATCLAVEDAGIVNPRSLTPLADSGFAIIGHDARLGHIELVNDRPVVTWGQRITADSAQAVSTPSADTIVTIGTQSLRSIEAVTAREIAHRNLPEALNAVAGFSVVESGIAICSDNAQISVYSVPELEPVFLPENTGIVQIPWLDPTARWLAYFADQNTLDLVDLQSGARETLVHNAALETAPYVPFPQVLLTKDRSKAVISHSRGMIVTPLDAAESAPMVIKRAGYRVSALIDPAEQYLSMRAFGDSSVRFWSLDTLEQVAELPGHDGSVVLHAFTRDAARTLTIDSSGALRVWASPGHTWREPITAPTSKTHALSIDTLRMEVLASDANGVVHAYPLDAAKEQVIGPRTAPVFEAVRSSVSRAGHYALASLDSDLELIQPDASSSKRIPLPNDAAISAVSFRPNVDELVVCSQRGEIFVIDPTTAGIARTELLPQGGAVSDIAWSPDGTTLAIARRDGRVQIIRAVDLSLTLDITASAQQIRKIEYTPDGRTIAAVGDEGRLILIDVPTATLRRSDRIAENSLFAMSIHLDGSTILVGDRTGDVHVLDVLSLVELAKLDTSGAVMSLVFAPDGNAVFVSPLDHPVERWDIGALMDSIRGIRRGQ